MRIICVIHGYKVFNWDTISPWTRFLLAQFHTLLLSIILPHMIINNHALEKAFVPHVVFIVLENNIINCTYESF
jgi:hypothetical protein